MSDDYEREKRISRILLWVSIVPFIIGVLMMSAAKTKTTYSTSSYWVAKDYNHVYAKYSGTIVDYISDNETCKIQGDEIIVITTKKGLHTTGMVITIIFGIFAGVVVLGNISASEWWQRVKAAILCEDE